MFSSIAQSSFSSIITYRIDGLNGLVTETLNTGKPLISGAKDGWLLRSPIIRVLVTIILSLQQSTNALQSVNNSLITLAKDRHASKLLSRFDRELSYIVNRAE